jgi:hypothetical protein
METATETAMVSYNGIPVPVAVPDDLLAAMGHLSSVRRGRFGVITDHQSGVNDDKCLRPTVSDITFITNPRYDRWLTRMDEAVRDIQFPTFIGALNPELYAEITTKAKGQDVEILFNVAKTEVLTSLTKSIAGDSDDSHRLGHRLCYATFTGGDSPVKCHLVTEDDGTGHKRPIINENGLMQVRSLMLPFYIVHRNVKDHGKWLPTNSRVNTLLKDAIKDATGIPPWKEISLGVGNFNTLTMDKQTVYGMVALPLRTVVTTERANLYAYIAGLSEGFFSAVEALAEMVVRQGR